MANTTTHAWPMDKDIRGFYDQVENPASEELVHYLLDRLKLAEAPTIYTMRVKEARAELLDRGVPEVCDLLAALERDNSRLTQRVKALEAENQELRYGRY